ncbi:MAG: ABC transporter permease [Alphaproteobacteria bacterium]|nr:ABC transporter permease [Alphaproteobacteria bacterium]
MSARRLDAAVARSAPPGARVAPVGGALVLFWVALAVLAPILAPFPPNAQDFAALAKPTPSAAHWLGTDHKGRDILSRLIWGARIVLTVAPLAVAAAYLIGTAMGMLAGYFGGWIDAAVSRVSDVMLSFPLIILYVIVIANIGPSAANIVLAVTLASAPGVSRIVRGLVLELKSQDYVAAAKLRGENAAFILIVEILPNCRGPLIVDACLRLGYTTINIGVLGFLGLGLPPPDPDWGGMIKETTALITVWPHMAVIPSIAVVSLVLGFNLLADGLNEMTRQR